jgi:AMP-activated protein kinase-like protein
MSETRFTQDGQRYLDGGPHGALEDRERGEADRLLRAAAAYRDALPALDAGLDRRVMAAVRTATPPVVRTGDPVRWLVEARVRPVWIPLAAAAAALLVWVATPRPAPVTSDVAVGEAVHASDTVYVRFELAAPQAHSAAVAGSFNDWDPQALPMKRGAGGTWIVTVPLVVGEHQYQFVVDGTTWQPDPSATIVEDGFGGRNSVIVVGPKGLVRT